MKISEMFMRRSLRWTAPAPLTSSSPAVGAASLDLRPVLQAQLTFRDDGLAGPQALHDDDIVADAQAGRDRLLIDRAIALDHEDKLAVLPRLHGLVRQDERVRDRRHAHA